MPANIQPKTKKNKQKNNNFYFDLYFCFVFLREELPKTFSDADMHRRKYINTLQLIPRYDVHCVVRLLR